MTVQPNTFLSVIVGARELSSRRARAHAMHLYVRSELVARSAELREEQRLAENNRLELVAEKLTHKLMPIRTLLPTVHRAFWRGVHERVLRGK